MSSDASYPIRLESLVFLRCSVVAVPNHRPGEGKVVSPPKNNMQASKVEGDESRYSVQMRTVINPEKDEGSPYSIDMECLALFAVSNELSDEEAARGVTINGHSVCYGAIRETVAWLTGRQPYGPLLLGMSVLRSPQPAEEGPKSE